MHVQSSAVKAKEKKEGCGEEEEPRLWSRVEGWVCRLLTAQTSGLELIPGKPGAAMHVCDLSIEGGVVELEGRDRRIVGAQQPPSLAESVSSSFSERPCLKT